MGLPRNRIDYDRATLQIPGVLSFQFRYPAWTLDAVEDFVKGYKRALLSDKEIAKQSWNEHYQRGFNFGDKLLQHTSSWNIPKIRLFYANITYSAEDLHRGIYPDSRSRSLFADPFVEQGFERS